MNSSVASMAMVVKKFVNPSLFGIGVKPTVSISVVTTIMDSMLFRRLIGLGALPMRVGIAPSVSRNVIVVSGIATRNIDFY